jgi:hypothetical protein
MKMQNPIRSAFFAETLFRMRYLEVKDGTETGISHIDFSGVEDPKQS